MSQDDSPVTIYDRLNQSVTTNLFYYQKKKYMTKKERNIEHEITLVISSKNSNDIADSIAGLNSISGYILRPAENKNIYDIYYDTKDHLLMRSKLSLRIRNIEGAWLCTFKGKSSLADSGGIIRKEIELPWSKDNIKTILIELETKGIYLPNWEKIDQTKIPRKAMALLGLIIIQKRETLRTIRNIVDPNDKNGIILAELAIDRTIYQLQKQEVYHYEIEIEEKNPGNGKLLKQVCNELFKKYKKSALKWRYNKLSIGKALEHLEKEGSIQNIIYPDNNLKPVAYKRIKKYLDQNRTNK